MKYQKITYKYTIWHIILFYLQNKTPYQKVQGLKKRNNFINQSLSPLVPQSLSSSVP